MSNLLSQTKCFEIFRIINENDPNLGVRYVMGSFKKRAPWRLSSEQETVNALVSRGKDHEGKENDSTLGDKPN